MATAAEAAARTVRIMKYSFLVYGVLLIIVVFRVPEKAKHPANASMEVAITLIALVEVALGFFAPQFLTKLSRNPRVAVTPEKQWMSRCVVSMSLFVSCILFGLVLHFVGANVDLVDLLFGVGMFSLAFWNPGAPPGTDGRTGMI